MAEGAQRGMVRRNESRVNIEYEVETGGARQRVELPFVMGVLSDLRGDTPASKPLSERAFDEVTATGVDGYMKTTKPTVRLLVQNRIDDGAEATNLALEIEFTELADFTPANLAEKVKPLKTLLDERNRLKALLSMIDGRPEAEARLERLLQDRDLMRRLEGEPGEER